MSQNYDFLRTFTFDGNETKHLFQIAKLNIPFLTKDNEFYTVGNTDGKHFRSTRLGDHTLSIDGFVIKDNTGKSVSDSLDELKVLVNSDEPKQLVFDVFPDRYFNAIFSGIQEYDATDLKYTPLTLTFDVPEGLAHAIESIGFSNTYSTTTNVMLDSEYNAINKYMKPWVQKLDEKFNSSNVVQGDFTNGIPLNFERDDKTDERWLNWNPATMIHTAELKAGNDVNFSVYAQVVSIDEENDKDYAGQVILEEWDTVKGAILKRHIVYIPKKVTTEFTEYGSVVKIENEKTNAINLQYGFRGSNLIKWSKPMVSFLPPIGETVTAPSVGAKAYSNSLDFGDYDYSGNPNLLDEPYYFSKVPLGENIADPTKVFPIKSSVSTLYTGNMTEPFVVGETYTITIKGTKPSTQNFRVFNPGVQGYGNLSPVEGLTDVWSLTFTPNKVSANPEILQIVQTPNESVGACQIDWLKIEKGDTRTPNIPYYKYEGIAPAPSNNPNDYHWGYSSSYINAVEYVPSGDSVGDLIKIENNGTYRTKPRFSFRMKGENGLVALLNQNGAILQFGNPEDVDGTISSRVEPAMNETFWGNTLNSALKVNTGFKSVYPNMNSNPSTPNKIQGTLNMTDDPDAVQPVYTGVGDINVWHGPTVVGDIAAPSNTDRTLPITTHFRFGFDNYNKGQRGRLEFSTFDELGNPIMTAIIRDSSTASNEIVFEAWYKNNKLHQMKLDRKVFNKSFYEMNMDRRGNRLVWRIVQIKSLNQAPGGWSQATIDKEYKFVWTLPEPDTSKFTKTGFWFMRFSNKYGVIMRMTDMQARWEGTPYYQDLKNYFQDGDLVEIDTATREIFVNGVVNNQLNVVGNQWEKFELETGETIIQPIVSEWANMAEVTAEITQNYL